MPTPPKPVILLKNEKKSHRTKAELNLREQGEKSLVSGAALLERSEVANNPIAHKEFLRVSELLENIEKNDALYEPIINRYCELQAECHALKEEREDFKKLIKEIRKTFNLLTEEADADTRAMLLIDLTNGLAKITNSINKIDNKLQAKRKMLFDIEKENIFTIASALRSIPKKQGNKKNALMEALGGG